MKTVIYTPFTPAQIVFNVVASVKFNEKLRDAVEINVLGTKKILDLVMGMKHLKVQYIVGSYIANSCAHSTTYVSIWSRWIHLFTCV